MVLLFCLAFPMVAGAGGALESALRDWHAGDTAAAMARWESLARSGSAEAALFLGYVYRNGQRVDADDRLAAQWYRQAAELGQPEAQYELALMYELGIGVAQDPAEAAAWYSRATVEACPAEMRAGGRLGDR